MDQRVRRNTHHGRTPAAWTSTAIAMVGFLVMAAGFFMNIDWLVVGIGTALVLLAAVVGFGMSRAGMGEYERRVDAH